MTKQQEYIDELETKIEWLQGIVDEAIAWRKSFGHLRAMADRLIKESRIATSKVTVARKALVRAIAASGKNAIVFDGVKYTINEVAEEGRALNWLDEEPFVAIVLGRTG